ncbi:hypothetical protein [Streptomyces erythrochromogenes]|uniref:hypothetical protein n=1 Tax=Streptomyces erythrochromogenes TaxID=285574 RepID=UPI0036F9DE9B
MTPNSNPLIFVNSHNPNAPAQLWYPEGVDPAGIVSRFPAGFFAWREELGCAEFSAVKSTEVMNALFLEWPYVRMAYGPHVNQPESSNEIKRPAGVRPRSVMAMGPRTPMAG